MQKTVGEYVTSPLRSGPRYPRGFRNTFSMNPRAKYNEFTLGLDRVGINKNLISGSDTSSWSLELILCEFEVHMSTVTSPTESSKLLLEMVL